MATKIQPITKSKTVDYSEALLQNFWQQKSHISANQNHKSEILKTLQFALEGIVCIQTESLTDKTVIKQIFDISQNLKVRFYILVNEYSQELDLLNEICLIRYDVKNIGSLILVNPNSDKPQGTFFTGQLTEQSMAVSQHITRSLEGKENEELFRHFCFQFWETAKKEVIEKRKHTNITSKPIDVFHDEGVFGGKNFVYGTLFAFSEKAKRGDLSGKQIIYLNNEKQIPITIHPKSSKDLGDLTFDNLFPKTEFENIEPNFVDDGVSVSMDYKWRNVPFYLPEKVTHSSLYDRWNKKKEEIIKVLDSILNKIQEAEKKENTISKALSRFFLGKKTTFNKLKSDIEDLKQTDFANITENQLKEKIAEINSIYSQVESEIGEIELEDKKAKLDEEIEDLKEKEKTKQEELTKKQEDLNDKEIEYKKKLKVFLEKYNLEEASLLKVKNEWQEKSGRKNKKKNPKEAEEAEAKLSELNEIQNAVFINKLKSEIEKLNKEIKRLEDDIKLKEKEKAKASGQQNEDKSSLSEFLSNKSSKQNSNSVKLLTVPDLPQLPQIGKLYEHNNQSYLAIEFWEEYEQGKREAERLKAKLCTINN